MGKKRLFTFYDFYINLCIFFEFSVRGHIFPLRFESPKLSSLDYLFLLVQSTFTSFKNLALRCFVMEKLH